MPADKPTQLPQNSVPPADPEKMRNAIAILQQSVREESMKLHRTRKNGTTRTVPYVNGQNAKNNTPRADCSFAATFLNRPPTPVPGAENLSMKFEFNNPVPMVQTQPVQNCQPNQTSFLAYPLCHPLISPGFKSQITSTSQKLLAQQFQGTFYSTDGFIPQQKGQRMMPERFLPNQSRTKFAPSAEPKTALVVPQSAKVERFKDMLHDYFEKNPNPIRCDYSANYRYKKSQRDLETSSGFPLKARTPSHGLESHRDNGRTWVKIYKTTSEHKLNRYINAWKVQKIGFERGWKIYGCCCERVKYNCACKIRWCKAGGTYFVEISGSHNHSMITIDHGIEVETQNQASIAAVDAQTLNHRTAMSNEDKNGILLQNQLTIADGSEQAQSYGISTARLRPLRQKEMTINANDAAVNFSSSCDPSFTDKLKSLGPIPFSLRDLYKHCLMKTFIESEKPTQVITCNNAGEFTRMPISSGVTGTIIVSEIQRLIEAKK